VRTRVAARVVVRVIDDAKDAVVMSTEIPEPPEPVRKPYEKPTLSEVPLRPDEAVLGSCKTAMTAGPVESTCGDLGGCFSLGS
jgi:hypothetical protein